MKRGDVSLLRPMCSPDDRGLSDQAPAWWNTSHGNHNLIGRRFRQGATFTPPRWNNPANSRPFESKMAFDGPNVWIFPSPAGAKTYEATPGLVD